MSTYELRSPVCRISANWTPFSANWIQFADICKLESVQNQTLSEDSSQFADCRVANCKLNVSPCNHLVFGEFPVCETSPPPIGGGEPISSPPPFVGGDSGIDGRDRRLSSAILSLDLGTQTGWALLGRDESITSGTELFKPQRFEGGGMRFLRFKRWLTEIKQSADGLEAVFFEEVRRHAGVDAAHVYGGFVAHLTAWCEHHDIPYQGVPVGTIKKHATGKGNANKQEMMAAMRALGFQPTDDNEADALALLMWAIKNC